MKGGGSPKPPTPGAEIHQQTFPGIRPVRAIKGSNTMDSRTKLRRAQFKVGWTTNEGAQEKRRREALAEQRAVSVVYPSSRIKLGWTVENLILVLGWTSGAQMR